MLQGTTDYEVLTWTEIQNYMNQLIDETSQLIDLPDSTTKILLVLCKWSIQVVMDRFYDTEKREIFFEEAGVLIPLREIQKLEKNDVSGVDCEICCLEVSATELYSLRCGHKFCSECWNSYLVTKILDEGMAEKISCLGYNCPILVDYVTCLNLLQDSRAKRIYERLIVNNFVKVNCLLAWCPGYNCNNVIKVDFPGMRPVTCSCGKTFCFSCSEDWHSPLRCHLNVKWNQKCAMDSKSALWILKNTRNCPGCGSVVYRDRGCDHMVCYQCFCKFCWICLDRRFQDKYHECQFTNAKKLKETEETKLRYLNHHRRYWNQHGGYRHAKEFLYNKVERTMQVLEKSGICRTEMEFLKRGIDILIDARKCLMYSCAFAYFVESNYFQAEVFTNNVNILLKASDELRQFFNGCLDDTFFYNNRQKLQNHMQFCDSRRRALESHVLEGYDKKWWKYTPEGMQHSK